MKDNPNEQEKPQIQELSEKEVMIVSGGFWPIVLAVVLSGCATIPHKGHQDK